MEAKMPNGKLVFVITQNMRPGLQDRLAVTQFTTVDELVRQCVAYEDAWTRNRIVPEKFCETRKQVHELQVLEDSNGSTNLNNSRIIPIGCSTYLAITQNSPYYHNQLPIVTHPTLQYNYPTYSYSQVQQPIDYSDHPVGMYNSTKFKPLVNAIASNREAGSVKTVSSSGIHIKHCWNCRQTGHYFKNCNHRILHTFCVGCGTPEDPLSLIRRMEDLKFKTRIVSWHLTSI